MIRRDRNDEMKLEYAEAVVKMIGLRHHYFTLPWNLFDLILVSASVVGLIMEDVLNEFPISPTLLRVVRVFRLGRVLRLVKVNFSLLSHFQLISDDSLFIHY